ncbi:hypothetical protein B7463_g7097, partial [Scytalidium lignicola]
MLSSFYSIILLASFHVSAYHIAQPFRQRLDSRSIYSGGWPLALPGIGSTCPPETPVACTAGNSFDNPTCCPSGQSCFTMAGEDIPYCCPTDKDCNTAVINFPVCANTSWTMFIYEGNYFFCCDPAKIAVKPITGIGGLCVPAEQVVPTSLLATATKQDTAAIPTSASTTSTNTASLNPSVAVTNSIQINPTASPSPSTPPSSSSSSSSSTPFHLTTPTIIGIAVGAFVLFTSIALCGWCRQRHKPKFGEPMQYFNPSPGNRYFYGFGGGRREQYNYDPDQPPQYDGISQGPIYPDENVVRTGAGGTGAQDYIVSPVASPARSPTRSPAVNEMSRMFEVEDQRHHGRTEVGTGNERHELGS